MSLYRILLIEPNLELGGILEKYFVRSGMEVINTVDARQGLEVARRQRPDLILSETTLPEADAMSLIRALRAEKDLGEIPILLLSGDANPERRLSYLDAGADGYVIKPFSMRELVLRCQRQITSHRHHEASELSGDLSRFKSTDILQMLEANRATGVLYVEGDVSGEIHLLDGYICGGFAGPIRGEDAVYQLIPVRRGRFFFVRTNIRSNMQAVHSTTELMMEALRRHDEKEHHPARRNEGS